MKSWGFKIRPASGAGYRESNPLLILGKDAYYPFKTNPHLMSIVYHAVLGRFHLSSYNTAINKWPRGVAVNMSPCHGEDHRFDRSGSPKYENANLAFFLFWWSSELIELSMLIRHDVRAAKDEQPFGQVSHLANTRRVIRSGSPYLVYIDI